MILRIVTKTARLAILLVVSIFLSGCSEELPTAPPPAIEITLNPGIPVTVEEQNVELTLLSVLDDVRCTTGDTTCDWPGMATADLLVVKDNDSNRVNLALGGEFPLDGSRFLWPLDTLGLQLTLIRLSPANPDAPIPQRNYRATIRVDRSSGRLPSEANIIISKLDPAAIIVDSFNIDSAWITRDQLNLTVSYNGGCRRHLFTMFMSPETFIETTPRGANLYLRHYGAGDMCRAVVSEDIQFNLGIITQNYGFTYAIVRPFQLNLFVPAFNGNTERVISLLFFPASDFLP